jgi:ABC-2 type transport system ATP-binding protein
MRAPEMARALSVRGAGQEWSVLCNGGRPEVIAEAIRLGAEIVSERHPSLDEIFVARAARKMEPMTANGGAL